MITKKNTLTHMEWMSFLAFDGERLYWLYQKTQQFCQTSSWAPQVHNLYTYKYMYVCMYVYCIYIYPPQEHTIEYNLSLYPPKDLIQYIIRLIMHAPNVHTQHIKGGVLWLSIGSSRTTTTPCTKCAHITCKGRSALTLGSSHTTTMRATIFSICI